VKTAVICFLPNLLSKYLIDLCHNSTMLSPLCYMRSEHSCCSMGSCDYKSS